MSEIALEIARATAAGDLQRLAALAIDLAAQHAAALAQLDEMRRADAERRRGAADRQARRRGGPAQPRDITVGGVTSRDVTQHHVTDGDVTLPPLPPPTPPNPTHTHTPPRTHARGATVSKALLEAVLEADRMVDVEAYLDAIGARNRDGWYTELLRIVGPATGITAADLVQGIRDAMLITPIVNRPGPLRAFVLQCKHDRTKSPPPSSNGNGSRRSAPTRPTQPYDASGNAAAARRLDRDLGGDEPSSSSTTTDPGTP